MAKHKVLDVVINDAGVSAPHGLTDDGFEYVMQVNYLSHFLLEQLFLPALRSSSAVAARRRDMAAKWASGAAALMAQHSAARVSDITARAWDSTP